jgi:RNA polymerase sigma-70 factor, ECF subfamily
MQSEPLESERQSSESELIAGAIRKDESAVRELIRRYNQRLYRLARSIVRDDNEAEDALQESYLRAFCQLSTFRGEAAFGTWLGRIVLNEALGRQKRRRLDLTGTEIPQVIPFPNASQPMDPERSLAQREIRQLLEQAIDELPEDFRAVLVARAIEGMSTKETAALLELNAKTVKTRLHRARNLVKQALNEEIGAVLGDTFPFAGLRCARLADRVVEQLDFHQWKEGRADSSTFGDRIVDGALG